MKKIKCFLFVSVFCVSMIELCPRPASAGTIFNANDLFAANELGAGLNSFGPFSAGYYDESVLGGFTPFTQAHHSNGVNGSLLEGWHFPNDFFVPAVLVNPTSNTIPALSFPVAPHQIFMHEGGIGSSGFSPPFYNAILRFTAPSSGQYMITGSWERLHAGITNDLVLRNGAVVFSSTDAHSSFNFGETLSVGDTIDFVVSRSYDGIGADSTGLFATVTETTAVPEPSSLCLFLGGGMTVAGSWYRRRVLRANGDLS